MIANFIPTRAKASMLARVAGALFFTVESVVAAVLGAYLMTTPGLSERHQLVGLMLAGTALVFLLAALLIASRALSSTPARPLGGHVWRVDSARALWP